MKNWEESFLFKRVITVQSTRKKVKEKTTTMHILSNKATQIAFAFFPDWGILIQGFERVNEDFWYLRYWYEKSFFL